MIESYRIGHLEVESPWGNAGGVARTVNEIAGLAFTGVGWLEAGSFTMEKRLSRGLNGELAYIHHPEIGASWNWPGMPNPGIDRAVELIPEMKRETQGKPLVVNVAPVSEEPVSETVELVTRAYEAGADAVLVNPACPNIVTGEGKKHEVLQGDAEILYAILGGLRPVTERYEKVYVRLPPLKYDWQMDDATESIQKVGTASTIFTPNAWPLEDAPNNLEPPEEANGVCGLSGPVTARDAWTQAFHMAVRNPELDIVSCAGITNGKELHKRLSDTATPNIVAGAGTTFFFQSGDWPEDVDRLLHQYLEAE